MSFLSSVRTSARALFSREQVERDMDEEMTFHIESRADDLVRNGLSRDAAQRRARQEFGVMDIQKDDCRQSLGLRLWDDLRADVRGTFRGMKNGPGFVVLAILCLTLGIGANAAVFSWIEGVLFRPYPGVANQDRLMMLAGTARGSDGYQPLSWPDLLDYQREAKLVEVIGEKLTGTSLAVGDRSEWTIGSMVSANYFDAMGIRMLMGRGFQPGEDQGRNAHPVVVISYQLWKDRFGGDPNILGRTQVLNSLPHTIIGVTAPGFYGTFVGYSFNFWVPISMQERFDPSGYKLEDRGAVWLEPFVLRKPGVTPAQAQAELSAIAARLEAQYPETNRGRGIKILPLWDAPFNNAGALRPTLGIALVVVVFVLLIACANVGNLLLVKSFGRRHEMTVRLAVGAVRRRLVKQLLTEGVILTAMAAVGGLLVAYWCRGLLMRIIPPRGVPLRIEGTLDWRVLVVTAGVAALSTLLFGLMPALQASNIDLAGSLKAESGGVVGGGRRHWIRSASVVVQISLSFLLLVGAGLLIQSVQRIRTSPPGFDIENVILTSVNLFVSGYDQPRATHFQDEFMDRLQSLGGVQSVAYARIAPFAYKAYSQAPIAVDGYQAPPDQLPTVQYDEVSPGFFATLGIPLLSGRDFTRADDEKSQPVAIVNEAMVAQYWRGENPVGRRLKVKDTWMQVVGVARQAKYGNPMEVTRSFFYVPLRQHPAVQVNVLIRTPQGPETMMPVLSREVHTLDPGLALYAVDTMAAQVRMQTAPQQIALSMLTLFGGLALVLAAVGLYGVMSFSVSQSSRAMGLRMALGAGPRDLMRLTLRHGMLLTAAGIGVGVMAALATTRLLGYLLYRVSPRDPLAFGSALAVMALASLAACFLPARRASRTDPLSALRM